MNSVYDRMYKTGSSGPFNSTPVDLSPKVRFRSNNGLGGAKLKLQQATQGINKRKRVKGKIAEKESRKTGNRNMCISFTRLNFAAFRRSTCVPYYCTLLSNSWLT
jgi:hypothetical protein